MCSSKAALGRPENTKYLLSILESPPPLETSEPGSCQLFARNQFGVSAGGDHPPVLQVELWQMLARQV